MSNRNEIFRYVEHGGYTEDDLDKIIEAFVEPCDICRGPHSQNHCPILQEETACPYCDEIFSNSHMHDKHLVRLNVTIARKDTIHLIVHTKNDLPLHCYLQQQQIHDISNKV